MSILIASKLRPCVYLALEEGLNESFADKLRRLEVRYDDFYVEVPSTVAELVNVVRERSPRCVIIDSIQASSLIPRDVRAIASMTAGLVVAVSQVNRAGDVSGSASWDHEADVLIQTEAMAFKTTKDRFGPLSQGRILQ
jgi:predicted ATP-dependent serine protease